MSHCSVCVHRAVVHMPTQSPLQGASLSAYPGTIHAVVGDSASGVDVVDRVLQGFVRVSSGHATILGLDCWADAVALQSFVSFAPADIDVWPQLSGREVMSIVGKISSGLPETHGERLAADFPVDLSKSVGAMSAEEQRLTALISAMSREASVYVLPQAFRDLSAPSRQQVAHALQERVDPWTTIILTGAPDDRLDEVATHTSVCDHGFIRSAQEA